MNYERFNIWSTTLYTLIQSLHVAKSIHFGDKTRLDENCRETAAWVATECSFNSLTLSREPGRRRLVFRRDPTKHFDESCSNVIRMLMQDLVVIFDQLMDECLAARHEKAGDYAISKIEKLSKHVDPKFQWSTQHCLECIAVRNVLTHGQGSWNQRSIAIVSKFIAEPPKNGDTLTIGFGMLFRYRKAIRTFVNQAKPA